MLYGKRKVCSYTLLYVTHNDHKTYACYIQFNQPILAHLTDSRESATVSNCTKTVAAK